MPDTMIDAPVYVDLALAVLLACAALAQYMWLAFHGHSLARWAQAIGWTGLSARLMWAMANGLDPHIAAVSIPFIALAAAGSAGSAIRQMRLLSLDIRCLQRPDQPCYRADRIKAALREKR